MAANAKANCTIQYNNIINIATRQSYTTDSAPGVATWEVTLSARNVVSCLRWPASGITAHSL